MQINFGSKHFPFTNLNNSQYFAQSMNVSVMPLQDRKTKLVFGQRSTRRTALKGIFAPFIAATTLKAQLSPTNSTTNQRTLVNHPGSVTSTQVNWQFIQQQLELGNDIRIASLFTVFKDLLDAGRPVFPSNVDPDTRQLINNDFTFLLPAVSAWQGSLSDPLNLQQVNSLRQLFWTIGIDIFSNSTVTQNLRESPLVSQPLIISNAETPLEAARRLGMNIDSTGTIRIDDRRQVARLAQRLVEQFVIAQATLQSPDRVYRAGEARIPTGFAHPDMLIALQSDATIPESTLDEWKLKGFMTEKGVLNGPDDRLFNGRYQPLQTGGNRQPVNSPNRGMFGISAFIDRVLFTDLMDQSETLGQESPYGLDLSNMVKLAFYPNPHERKEFQTVSDFMSMLTALHTMTINNADYVNRHPISVYGNWNRSNPLLHMTVIPGFGETFSGFDFLLGKATPGSVVFQPGSVIDLFSTARYRSLNLARMSTATTVKIPEFILNLSQKDYQSLIGQLKNIFSFSLFPFRIKRNIPPQLNQLLNYHEQSFVDLNNRSRAIDPAFTSKSTYPVNPMLAYYVYNAALNNIMMLHRLHNVPKTQDELYTKTAKVLPNQAELCTQILREVNLAKQYQEELRNGSRKDLPPNIATGVLLAKTIAEEDINGLADFLSNGMQAANGLVELAGTFLYAYNQQGNSPRVPYPLVVDNTGIIRSRN